MQDVGTTTCPALAGAEHRDIIDSSEMVPTIFTISLSPMSGLPVKNILKYFSSLLGPPCRLADHFACLYQHESLFAPRKRRFLPARPSAYQANTPGLLRPCRQKTQDFKEGIAYAFAQAYAPQLTRVPPILQAPLRVIAVKTQQACRLFRRQDRRGGLPSGRKTTGNVCGSSVTEEPFQPPRAVSSPGMAFPVFPRR